ncbi:MAG: 23S rRNA (guanosine(2251)-2'-O)-methyltransferase RlmB [Bacteroidales bacterium]|nr:23S rRNA (guanosine(2251)-2'-O)-methyltransferase RlmB [Bacteroidales bacterium]
MKPKKDLIFGMHSVSEAVRSGKAIEKVLVRKGLTSPVMNDLFRQFRSSGTVVQYVPEEKLNRLAGKNHQGIVALISKIEYYRLEEIVPFVFEKGKSPIILVLDSITDVRNFGAIARTAECAGVDAILVPVKGSASINADAVKTSAGALHNIPVCRTSDLAFSLEFLQNSGLRLIGASEKAEKTYFNTDFTLPFALIMGAEDRGISPRIMRMTDSLVRIPVFGMIQSLNVGVAASLIIYEAVRQRTLPAGN